MGAGAAATADFDDAAIAARRIGSLSLTFPNTSKRMEYSYRPPRDAASARRLEVIMVSGPLSAAYTIVPGTGLMLC
jgi:hypothetical protein